MTDFRNKVRGDNPPAAGADETETTARLVDRAAGGDGEAFGRLYTTHVERIYRYIFYQVRDKMTAEDITEEVFLKAWRSIGSCRGKGDTFSSWLYRIAHNRVVDTFRSQRRQVSLEMTEDTMAAIGDPAPGPQARLEQQEMLQAVSSLPRNQWQVIMLKFIEGLSNREIGQALGKKEGAVRALQMRGLAALRQVLGGHEQQI